MAGMREKRREGCSEGEVEVNGKFNQDASFKSIGTRSDSSVLSSTWPGVEGTGQNVFMKPDFSWVPSRCQALIWGQCDDQDGQDPCPPEDYILVMEKGNKHKERMDSFRE